MEVFVRVAECGSFSRAAESLDLANATVTTCVRNLERHLDVTLINRDTRRLRLTEEGQMYLPRARELLQSVARTEEEVRTRLGELRGWLHIETPISVGHALLCPALPAFAQRYPEISAAITLTNQPHHMIERGIDVAIRMDHVENADLVARPVYESRYVICCTPALAQTLPAHPAQLNPRRCIGILAEERRHANAWVLEKGQERLEIRPGGSLHFNTSDALLLAARSGVGVAHVLDIFAHRLLDSGELAQVYPDWTTTAKTFYAVTVKGRASSAKARAFTDFLVEVLDSERRLSAKRAVSVRALGKH
ncbi:MAG: LysR family transcriptional regulator [Betaproteobacteria bacterium]|nr:LysR family transcriptional regulator [Betaproteobacteria bacterium]